MKNGIKERRIFLKNSYLSLLSAAIGFINFGIFQKVLAATHHGVLYPAGKTLKNLIQGNEDFKKLLNHQSQKGLSKDAVCNQFVQNHIDDLKKEFDQNRHDQKPKAIVIGCADSRVSPEIIFNQGIGSLFVIRLAGNFIDGAGHPILGSIEYAVKHLGVRLIIILGHHNCGAIKAALEKILSPLSSTGSTSKNKNTNFLDFDEPLAELIETIRDNMDNKELESLLVSMSQSSSNKENIYNKLMDESIKKNIKKGIEYLSERKIFKELLADKTDNQLLIKGAIYSVENGNVEIL